ncbi:MAG: hypothetical protein JWL97_3721 [Gemmatimonadales bacterium]|nr:hypothetical protein [Gemmatimonadales bacterium]
MALPSPRWVIAARLSQDHESLGACLYVRSPA